MTSRRAPSIAEAILLLAVAVFVTGCSFSPIVSSPSEGPKDPARGNVTALRTLLAGKDRAVVVMIHGVGDHCPGFALDQNVGWLNTRAEEALGLVAGSDETRDIEILDDEFLPGHPKDAASKVTVRMRAFGFPASSPPSERIPVTVVEITWSQLTQWIKTNQLKYDQTRANPSPSTTTGDCPYTLDTEYKKPPGRQALNRLLKEQILNRSLADAVIYAGTYGRVLRRGIAEALCRSVDGTASGGGHLCNWPTPPDTHASKTAYFFVTHSLGSRLIYDTLLGLTGTDVTDRAGTFDDDEVKRSKPYAAALMVETASVYMMANQLPMLGLAYEDGTRTSGEGPFPYEPLSAALAHPTGDVALPAERSPSSSPKTQVKLASVTFAEQRMEIARALQLPARPLTIVAFSDTNDLLSWGVPKWYLKGATPDELGVDFTNVYVRNDARWLGLIENPASAHTDYFVDGDVWQTIRCGAVGGTVPTCH